MKLIVLLLLLLLSVALVGGRRTENYQEPDVVYCLMVTGKDEQRIDFARGSVKNFMDQDFGSKKLIIINHHPTLRVTNDTRHDDVVEVAFDKSEGRTLGDMRNLSLDMVPTGALWTTWDDDDYRHPTYLSQLHGHLVDNYADAVFQTHRYEYNYKTGFAWGFKNDDGFWIVFARKTKNVKYHRADANEDIDIRQQVTSASNRVYIWKNSPYLYVRTVHGNNTSTTLNQEKAALNNDGHDYAVTPQEHRYIMDSLATVFS